MCESPQSTRFPAAGLNAHRKTLDSSLQLRANSAVIKWYFTVFRLKNTVIMFTCKYLKSETLELRGNKSGFYRKQRCKYTVNKFK